MCAGYCTYRLLNLSVAATDCRTARFYSRGDNPRTYMSLDKNYILIEIILRIYILSLSRVYRL
jgi:hypothetical protein